MKKINRKILFISILSFFLFLLPFKVSATTANASFSGNNSVYIGESFEVYVIVSEAGSGPGEGVAGIQGPLSYDTSKIDLISAEGLSLNAVYANGKIAGMVTSPSGYLLGTKNVVKLVFRAKALGEATISMRADISDANASNIYSNTISKTINIVNPPSGNNNLKSLSTNIGGLNFNGSTNYNITVENDVTSINVNGEVEDPKAQAGGFGTKSLNYGNNVINIVVRAENGSSKTYTINVVRKDNRSNNNNLSSLKVNGGTINPGFNKNTTSYSLTVPYEINNLNVTATPEDPKAKVSVQNTNLIAEETTDVKVVVTAENGSSKTYIIHTLRGKDPNKVLSTNNYLASLTISDGLLSPGFDKNQENYIVYLPYEVENITINYSVEDTKYATVEKEGPDKLSVGNNLYKLHVKAENEEIRTYTITVARGKNLLTKTLSNDVYLKYIKVINGNLNQVFDKKNNFYTYSGKKIKVEAEANNKNSRIEIIEKNGVYNIVVISESGEIGVYTLVKTRNTNSLLLTIALIIIVIATYVFGYKLGNTKKIIPEEKEKKKRKKIKKEKETEK